jgi:hypothetical protein
VRAVLPPQLQLCLGGNGFRTSGSSGSSGSAKQRW